RRHTRSYGDWSSDVCSSDLRMMQWGSGGAGDSAYLDGQKQLFAKVQLLGGLRAAHPALRRGDRATLFSSGDAWVYSMASGADREIGRASCRERVYVREVGVS